ncbi:hypothetical protein ALP42_200067 [Pseudomonas savastanoi pv. nerii]|uniref:Uncharacterized protein n=2 Tax=Pseudomonas savastanoi TaxID=29438 RepID=A0AB74BF76_PSESS|nr:hypothetical protein PSA3335_05085 [Pseudomonas savastanoi pv. savastanoi NCPPB 3335]KAA3532542.1 hypothetical protein DXU85_29380 [Pseudomonas savastanoi]KPY65573.1 hypothetical protein ALO58_200177 [Pseudomonas savastanoi pv. savastanoi]RMT72692.1 hypothetical protein ALP42_200067 [Pseudomonas savastanoi pv. nerii]RML68644.1 hypothetical protein ALQ90_200119 [Pseudomonas savastanoi pv. savastanoi]
MTAKIRRAASLRPGQFKHFIRVASVTGRMPELKRRGIDLRIICEILGIESLDAVRKLCAGDPARLGDIVRRII